MIGQPSVTSTGAGVTIYVLDEGINVNLPEFGGRASVAWDFLDPDNPNPAGSYQYSYGAAEHPTSVAAVAAGATWGVAKQAKIKSVKVQDCPDANTCPLDKQNVIAGMNWVKDHSEGPSVALIPLNFPDDPGNKLKDAVNDLSNSGVFVVVSAGNVNETKHEFNYNACWNYPANALGAMVAAASDASDFDVTSAPTPEDITWTSAFGGCVDIFAPGQWIDTKKASGTDAIKSGTSYSAPYVAGAAALYKSKFGEAPSPTIKSWLLQNSSPMKRTHNAYTWLYGTTPTARLSLAGL